MNWEHIKADWKDTKGKVKAKWGKLTDDDITVINGKQDQLVGRIQERYGIAKEEAEKQVEEFARTYDTDEATTRERVNRATSGR